MIPNMRTTKGNLLDADEYCICHQCNCVSKNKAAGLAKAIFDRFPHADVYSDRTDADEYSERNKRDIPGTVVIRGREGRPVIAMMAQIYPGKARPPNDSKERRKVFFQKCLDELSSMDWIESFAFPWGIGCGLAGGDWKDYEWMLRQFDEKVPVDVVVYQL